MRAGRGGGALTDRIDIEEAHRRPEDGVKHAVMQRLGWTHQDVKEDQAAKEAKHYRGGC